MMVGGMGYLAGRNQSRSLYTVITFPNQHANFPFASSSSSTFPLPCSLSPPPPPPLLSFPSTFPDMWSSKDTPVTVFTALYTFLSSPFLSPLCSLSDPLHAHFSFCLITHQGLFYSGTHEAARWRKHCQTVCFFGGVWSLTRAHCVSFFLQLWTEILRMRRTNWVFSLWLLDTEAFSRQKSLLFLCCLLVCLFVLIQSTLLATATDISNNPATYCSHSEQLSPSSRHVYSHVV